MARRKSGVGQALGDVAFYAVLGGLGYLAYKWAVPYVTSGDTSSLSGILGSIGAAADDSIASLEGGISDASHLSMSGSGDVGGSD